MEPFHASFSTADGLATLGPSGTAVLDALDACALRWAGSLGAAEVRLSPLVRIADLTRIDYFSNFPHLAMLATGIDPHRFDGALAQSADGEVGGSLLNDAQYALPSAACYNVYFHLEHTTVSSPRYVSTRGTCFRNELEYTGLTRLNGFNIREFVCLGTGTQVKDFLARMTRYLRDLVEHLGLPVDDQVATDPFFDAEGSRAIMQRRFPVKHEFVFKGVALASTNNHRNFFGERCSIRLQNGEYVSTGCLGLGLERWVWALTEHFEGDTEGTLKALQAYALK